MTKDRGRGVFASRDQKSGDLLVVEKAAVLAAHDEDAGA